ncbi:Lysosomal alpha-mannosidase [Seminavis robusta]|uniref:Alpha-mannosidase n=1 Tax=Seminavis robusta TaxID=568900 RepID=A0A9N8DY06_9STRA|nr:Lysosomal alpha-mannosidase [Seminavis robusta]|eukprot:Sro357_g125670.1 Lysosomal alpha-mannosidase (1117) ;mRNA; f:39821-43497
MTKETSKTSASSAVWRLVSSLIILASVLLLSSLTLFKQDVRHENETSDDHVRNLIKEDDQGGIQKMAAVDDPKVLNVHVVPHTHDDVGWLKTVEQYFYGLNMTIQKACVKDILDTVVEALLDNPHRTFTYVEMRFFSMWFYNQTDAVKDSVRFLIANKQLSFANGGWCMHDEAATHFMGMIDQTTLGHAFLKEELGYIPKVGWQLDPFGHSATQSSLLSAKTGFDALYFGRIDYQDLDIRKKTQQCEGLWASSEAWKNDTTSTLFWGLTGSYSGNYGSPPGFCFDVLCPRDPRLVEMNRTALLTRIQYFASLLKTQSDRTQGNHIMLTMGEDFNYRHANSMFANTDLMVSSVNMFQRWNLLDVPSIMGPRFNRINIFYSSPEYYTQMKHAQTEKTNKQNKATTQSKSTRTTTTTSTDGSVEWKTKTDDFFPYSDCPHCFWTGYFTSRAAFKRLERVSSSFLLAARQIESFPDTNGTSSSAGDDEPLYELEDALGVAQHHDAVSGTAKQHVSNDYSRRLQSGINRAAIFVENKLKQVLANGSSVLNNLTYCQLINETICEVSQEATKETGNDMYVVVYNPLGSNKSRIIRLPVSASGPFEVTKMGNESDTSTSQYFTATSAQLQEVRSTAAAKYVLSFSTGALAHVGATTFKVTRTTSDIVAVVAEKSRRLQSKVVIKDSNEAVAASNGLLEAQFDRNTGALEAISMNNVTVDVSQSWGYYTSFDNKMDKPDNTVGGKQNSGAYIFRPSKPNQELNVIPYAQGAIFVNNSLGLEVHAQFEERWIKQVTRVMKGLPYVDIEFTIGPIPIDDNRGKEIVTRFNTAIQSNATFYTDSNGREFQKRHRNFRPSWPLDVYEPVAGNYYPVNAAIYIEDKSSSFSVLVDRTQGGASLLDGSVELMAHRRLVADDRRGVTEPMNETDGGVTPYPPYGTNERWGEGLVIRGSHRIMIGAGNQGASLARSEMDESFANPLVFVASAKSDDRVSLSRVSFSALQAALPPNVMLVTFKKLHGNHTNEYLIRLGHQYSLGEDDQLSKPATIDLSNLFAGFTVASVTEMTLSANQAYDNWIKTRLDWTGSGGRSLSGLGDDNTTVVLQPMDVRTYVVALNRRRRESGTNS